MGKLTWAEPACTWFWKIAEEVMSNTSGQPIKQTDKFSKIAEQLQQALARHAQKLQQGIKEAADKGDKKRGEELKRSLQALQPLLAVNAQQCKDKWENDLKRVRSGSSGGVPADDKGAGDASQQRPSAATMRRAAVNESRAAVERMRRLMTQLRDVSRAGTDADGDDNDDGGGDNDSDVHSPEPKRARPYLRRAAHVGAAAAAAAAAGGGRDSDSGSSSSSDHESDSSRASGGSSERAQTAGGARRAEGSSGAAAAAGTSSRGSAAECGGSDKGDGKRNWKAGHFAAEVVHNLHKIHKRAEKNAAKRGDALLAILSQVVTALRTQPAAVNTQPAANTQE
jgi:hypothetical protein